MRFLPLKLVATSLAVTAMAVLCAAQEREVERPVQGGGGQQAEAKVVESEVEDHTPANAINFAGELNLPFQSLVDLGSQIERARLAADPVALASAARYLAAAEKAAGRQASVTSDSIMEESVELAKLRRRAAELTAVAILADDHRSSMLQELAALAAVEEQERKEASDEVTRHFHGQLTVRNRSNQEVTIYADGTPLGWVPPMGERYFQVNARHNLLARGCFNGQWLVGLDGLHLQKLTWDLR